MGVGPLRRRNRAETESRAMRKLLWRLWWGEDGQDLTEYALLLLFLALAAIASIRSLTGSMENVFNSAGNQMALPT